MGCSKQLQERFRSAGNFSPIKLETIVRRSWMLAQGKCSPTEFARMVLEKQQALSLSGFALLSGASAASILAPFHRGATANAKRLRRK